jgi:hypothetical protein
MVRAWPGERNNLLYVDSKELTTIKVISLGYELLCNGKSQPLKIQKYMGSMKKNNTHRNYKRFKVQKGVFMQIRGLLNLRCKIIHVSRVGLAFIYNDIGNRPGEKVHLDIFLKKNRFLMKNLPVKIISDSQVSKKSLLTFRKKRQCGAQFVRLIHNQVEQLECFIKCYTGGEI